METGVKAIIDLKETSSDNVALAIFQNQHEEDQHILGIFENDELVCVVLGTFVHIEALYITLHDYFESMDKVPDLSLQEPIDKFSVMQALEKLYSEDQQCSGMCDECKYESACNKLQLMLEDLFGYQG
jgi:hypothetical protein